MAFDAGMLYAVLHEIRENCLGARVEKTYQPTKEEVLLLMRGKKVSIYLGSSCPRIAITQLVKDNPAVPPMFCMLLRKHLTGAVLLDVSQIGFDRVAKLTFSGYDEMGFRTEKILYAELMGKYGNLILTDAEQKILAVAKPVDFSDSEVRQLLPGLRYAPPAPPDKRNPLEETAEGFSEKLHTAPPDKGAVRLITDFYGGTATDVAREIVFRAAGKTDATVGEIEEETFSRVFLNWFTALREYRLSPSVMRDGEKKPIAYGYAPFAHLSGLDNVEHKESLGALFDAFFEEKDRAERIRLRASDLVRTVSRIQAKLVKKLALQREECEKASHGEEQKHYGDLIIANIHLAKKGMTSLLATDYEKYPPRTEEVPLDPRLTPTQNAQKYYKLYTKAKTAAKITAEQAVLTQNELSYIESVDSFLEKAETEADLNEIREELY
ncbi:MAG: NFACT family protein, partial [Clostridia bacterium]|nr:NFACT family protein [Clostridia bacterium]